MLVKYLKYSCPILFVMKNKSIVNVTKGFIYQQKEYKIIHSSQTSRGGMNINVF